MVNLALVDEIERQFNICLNNTDKLTTDYKLLAEFLWLQLCIHIVLIETGNADIDTACEYVDYFFNRKTDNAIN